VSRQALVRVAADDLLGGTAKNRIVAFVVRRLHKLDIRASHNIEVTISLGLQVLSTDHSSDLCIVVNLFKLLAAGVLLILLVDQVKGGSSVVLFSSVELFNLSVHTLVLILVSSCQLLEFVHLTF
jgi:hypothetical protein